MLVVGFEMRPLMNKLQPDPNATGSHTVFKRDPTTGKITGYETYEPQTSPRNLNRWESVRRTDLQGKPHFNKNTGQDVPTPHVHDTMAPGGVRGARPDEIPGGG
jgi:Bacterial toxin 24